MHLWICVLSGRKHTFYIRFALKLTWNFIIGCVGVFELVLWLWSCRLMSFWTHRKQFKNCNHFSREWTFKVNYFWIEFAVICVITFYGHNWSRFSCVYYILMLLIVSTPYHSMTSICVFDGIFIDLLELDNGFVFKRIWIKSWNNFWFEISCDRGKIAHMTWSKF